MNVLIGLKKPYFRLYEYEHFSNVQRIGTGGFGKVYRANWKNSNKYLALKSFASLNNITAKEIVQEVIIVQCVVRQLLYVFV